MAFLDPGTGAVRGMRTFDIHARRNMRWEKEKKTKLNGWCLTTMGGGPVVIH